MQATFGPILKSTVINFTMSMAAPGGEWLRADDHSGHFFKKISEDGGRMTADDDLMMTG